AKIPRPFPLVHFMPGGNVIIVLHQAQSVLFNPARKFSLCPCARRIMIQHLFLHPFPPVFAKLPSHAHSTEGEPFTTAPVPVPANSTRLSGHKRRLFTASRMAQIRRTQRETAHPIAGTPTRSPTIP